jgi:glycosyltransferase involved in cell wall biosynthesis
MKLSILIPVFRGKSILPELLRKINESLDGKYEYEVLFICDGCDGDSTIIVKELKLNNPERIKVFHFAHNYGQHRALQFGFGKASGDLVITMDEDLQHDPTDILRLVEKQISGNYDIVYGKFNDPQHKGTHNWMSALLRIFLKHFIPTLYDNYSPFRLIKRDIALRTTTMVCPYTFIDDFLSRVTQNIAFEDVTHYKRMEGNSSYTFFKLAKHGIYILLAYSKLIPLLLAAAGVFVVTGSIMFALNVISPENLNTELINNKTIIVTIVIGLFCILSGFIGSIINQRNSIINTRPIKLIDEDTV